MNNTRTVLITGATGFLGKQAFSALEVAGWSVTQGVRSVSDRSGAQFLHVDLAQPETILALKTGYCFDAIVHLGAHIGWSGASEAEMFVPNVLSTGLLASIAKDWGAHFVYASAAIVCGARKERIDQATEVVPDTDYARSKYLGELLIAASHASNCNLRIAGVFGGNGPRHLGLNRAIDEALKGNAPTQVGSGDALRNYIYVKDVAQAIVSALEHKLEGTHLLAGSEVMSIHQMLTALCNVYLPGQSPLAKVGAVAASQVIQSSSSLPKARSFHEALVDIQETKR